MTYALLNMFSILIMIRICWWLAYKIKTAEYSLLTCFIQLLVHRNVVCFKWYIYNPRYIWYMVLQLAIMATALTQIGMFMENSIFTRPIFIVTIAPILWFSIYRVLKSYDDKLARK